MHMADALISPTVGGALIVAAAGTVVYSAKKIKSETIDKKIPLMGVMGAFIFAAQMINFSIPGTGSSGHIGGGVLLAILLGPFAGFLTMVSILLIQALFFGDGGLLAYGCNVMNLGFFACFLAYPLIYRKIISSRYSVKRIFTGSIISVLAAVQLGAFFAVLETVISGKTGIPFSSFLLVMQPIHLAIGLIEGIITGGIVLFIYRERPELITGNSLGNKLSRKNVILVFIIAAILIGGLFSWFASGEPDGLEWSIFKVTGKKELSTDGDIYNTLSDLQEKTVMMPDYTFRNDGIDNEDAFVKTGTSTAGIIGGAATLLAAAVLGFSVKIIKKKHRT